MVIKCLQVEIRKSSWSFIAFIHLPTSLCPFYSYLLLLVLCLLQRCKARIWVTFPGSSAPASFLILNTELQAAGSQSAPSELFMAAEAVSAGCPLHLAVYRHVFSAPGAQAQMCIPADKASIFRVLSLMCSAQEHQLISSLPDLCPAANCHIFTVTVGSLEDGAFLRPHKATNCVTLKLEIQTHSSFEMGTITEAHFTMTGVI